MEAYKCQHFIKISVVTVKLHTLFSYLVWKSPYWKYELEHWIEWWTTLKGRMNFDLVVKIWQLGIYSRQVSIFNYIMAGVKIIVVVTEWMSKNVLISNFFVYTHIFNLFKMTLYVINWFEVNLFCFIILHILFTLNWLNYWFF